MADGLTSGVPRRPSIEAVRGEFTLDMPVGSFNKVKHRCDLLIAPPMVRGAWTRIRTGQTVSAAGFFVQRERQSSSFQHPLVRGELTILMERNGAEKVIPFDTDHYWSSLSKVSESLREGLSGWHSDDLLRQLARILAGAEEDLAATRKVCAELADQDGPQELLRYAEELWHQARLHLLLGDAREAASCAVRGADRATESGLQLDVVMGESGSALAFVLGARGQARAAGRVRTVINRLDAAGGR